MTTLYLVRHSEPFKVHRGIEDINETVLFSSIKSPLSINGEHLAETISGNSEFNNLDSVWASDYENFKLQNGESQKEVRERISKFVETLLTEYKNKRILIVCHSTATAFLLKNWCDVSYSGNYKFRGNIFFDGKWNYCETFKLEFDDNNDLLSIKNLKF